MTTERELLREEVTAGESPSISDQLRAKGDSWLEAVADVLDFKTGRIAVLERLLAAPEQEPVAWRHRQRGPNESEWQEWHVVGYKPQGPESSRFQMAPLYASPPPQPASQWISVKDRLPEEPTEEMITAYLKAQHDSVMASDQCFGVSDPRKNFRAGYKAMLAAIPKERT